MKDKKAFRLRRVRAGRYETTDGLFTIWQSPGDGYCERNWNVNHRDFDEACTGSGFRTKWEAVAWLAKEYKARTPCYFADAKPGSG